MTEIDTADVVLHKPSGEEWLVAFVKDGRLCACGWPLSLVPIEDCELVGKAETQAREKLLREMASLGGSDPRGEYARAALAPPPKQLFGIIDPDYARVFTQARIKAWQYGYACLAHGSFTRDLDLLLVPWTDAARADDVDYFAPRIAEAAGLVVSPHPPSTRPHGRKTWTLVFPGFADARWVDLSVLTPLATQGAAT